MNITIPEELARELEKLIGPRNKSNFISEALRQRIEETRRQKLNEMLEEGYKARKQESVSLAKEFEPVDMEGWDEY